VGVAAAAKEKIEMVKWIGFTLTMVAASLLASPAGPTVTLCDYGAGGGVLSRPAQVMDAQEAGTSSLAEISFLKF
jgi:hypothetical protein